jgi:hypothetical protein
MRFAFETHLRVALVESWPTLLTARHSYSPEFSS